MNDQKRDLLIEKFAQNMSKWSDDTQKKTPLQQMLSGSELLEIYKSFYNDAFIEGYESGYQKRSEELTKLN